MRNNIGKRYCAPQKPLGERNPSDSVVTAALVILTIVVILTFGGIYG